MSTARTFTAGDRVRYEAFGVTGNAGTVEKTTTKAQGVGGSRTLVRVRWDNGHVGTVEDRVLAHISEDKP